MPAERVVLLSVRPRFATALLDGTKTVEVRRRRARFPDDALCLIYASCPVKALLGAIQVGATYSDTPDSIWLRWGDATGLERQEYDEYLAGRTHACAIVVKSTLTFSQPVSLSELRRRQKRFVTPQSYRFVDTGELASLMNGQGRQLEHFLATDKTIHSSDRAFFLLGH